MNKKNFNCNMELTLDIIGEKWKPILIYHIVTSNKIRFGELRRKVPNISERILSRELRELEQLKIINRDAYKEKILRVEYSLTPIGNEVLPLLHKLTE